MPQYWMIPPCSLALLVIGLAVCPVFCKPPDLSDAAAKKKWILQYQQSLYDAHKRKLSGPSEIVNEWQENLDIDWPCDYVREFYEARGQFDPIANVLAGIDVFNNEIFVTVYRTSEKVPAGLNKVVVKNGKSLLQPYPSLAKNELGKCTNLQYPIATTTDPNTGHMYVIDVGSIRPLILSPPESSTKTPDQACPPKLVVLDINKNGALVRSHDLDLAVLKNTNYLRHLVLDYGDRSSTKVKYAYITDSGNERLVVFSFDTNTTWFFQHDSMKYDEDQLVTENGSVIDIRVSITGIALNPDYSYAYYSSLGSHQLSQIPTSVLRDPNGKFAESHRFVGNKISPSDGMVSGKKGIYFGALKISSLYRWNIHQDIKVQNTTEANVSMNNQTQILKEANGDYWIGSAAFDDKGYIWLTARSLTSDSSKGSNYKIYRVFVNDENVLIQD